MIDIWANRYEADNWQMSKANASSTTFDTSLLVQRHPGLKAITGEGRESERHRVWQYLLDRDSAQVPGMCLSGFQMPRGMPDICLSHRREQRGCERCKMVDANVCLRGTTPHSPSSLLFSSLLYSLGIVDWYPLLFFFSISSPLFFAPHDFSLLLPFLSSILQSSLLSLGIQVSYQYKSTPPLLSFIFLSSPHLISSLFLPVPLLFSPRLSLSLAHVNAALWRGSLVRYSAGP